MQHQLKTVTAGSSSMKIAVHGKIREDLSLAVLAWAMGLDLLGAQGANLWARPCAVGCQVWPPSVMFVNADKVGQLAGRE